MEENKTGKNQSASSCYGESSEPKIEINVKTLDSRIHTFVVGDKIPVQLFKEEVAIKTGVPVNMQRLIFRGKVLKDDHLLSEYHVGNSHTLHLVERQPVQPQPATPPRISDEANGNNSQGVGGPQGRIGQISHSVLLGTFNVGEPTGGMGPEISRVIGAVFNSLGIGPLTAAGVSGEHATMQANLSGQPTVVNMGDQGQDGGSSGPNQSQYGNQTNGSQGIPQPPSFQQMPDSLNTLYQFMGVLEMGFSLAGIAEEDSRDAPQPTGEDPRNVTLPLNERGLPTPEALLIVLQRVERLFSGPTAAALAHVSRELEREGRETDVERRQQAQVSTVQVGFLIQQLGSLLLELGRTIMSLRIGASPEQSSVNAGPAIYITPTRPNPIMVQPSSFSPFGEQSIGFAGSAGGIQRHVNIHIHAGVASSQAAGRTESGDGETRGEPMVVGSAPAGSIGNIFTAALPIPGPVPSVGIVIPVGVQSALPASQDAAIRAVPAPLISQGVPQNQVGGPHSVDQSEKNPSGVSLGLSPSIPHTEEHTDMVCENPNSTENGSISEEGPSVPLGLGSGGLRPKRLNKHPRIHSRNEEEPKPGLEDAVRDSDGASGNGLSFLQNMGGVLFGGQGQNGNFDIGSVMSQVVDSPALDGLFAGVSQQAGMESGDALRNLMGQVTQNPTVRNALGQIANRIVSRDQVGPTAGPGGGGGGGGGGVDFSQLVQQMMPIVSQVLGGGGGGVPEPSPEENGRDPGAAEGAVSGQVEANDRGEVDFPGGIFRRVVEKAAASAENGSAPLVEDLCSDVSLVDEYKGLLKYEVDGRVQKDIPTRGDNDNDN